MVTCREKRVSLKRKAWVNVYSITGRLSGIPGFQKLFKNDDSPTLGSFVPLVLWKTSAVIMKPFLYYDQRSLRYCSRQIKRL